MPRDNAAPNIGIAWDPDPDPEVYEYLVYWKETDDDDDEWLLNIDNGTLRPNYVTAETQFVFPDGHPELADHAVVSHARNVQTGLERWSAPYFPEAFEDIPLDQSAPPLAGPSGGRVITGG